MLFATKNLGGLVNIKFFFIATGLLLSLSSNAENIESHSNNFLTTPALYPIAPNTFTCSLTNVSSSEHKIRIRIFNGDGVMLKDSQKISLATKHTTGLDSEGLPNGGYMYCEFAVDGHKGDYRGVAKIYAVNGGNDLIAIAAE